MKNRNWKRLGFIRCRGGICNKFGIRSHYFITASFKAYGSN